MRVRWNVVRRALAVAVALGALAWPTRGSTAGLGPVVATTTPIKHVVLLFMENHSFDNVLGHLCVTDARCAGATTARLSTGKTVALPPATDLVPHVPHASWTQVAAINGGTMDGWDTVDQCEGFRGHPCLEAFRPKQIPNLAALARAYAISDATFADELVPTFGSHVFLLAAQLGGFAGDNPLPSPGVPRGPGFGCDSDRDANWRASPADPWVEAPSCFPTKSGVGPYRPSPVPWIPTIMTRLDGAGLPWRIYRAPRTQEGYLWAGCPYFADCLWGRQRTNVVSTDRLVGDARAGTLPPVSLVFPTWTRSQHNGVSMAVGDNWIGDVVEAIQRGPNWASTAVFITYDDCGCFYDHVRPPRGLGIRAPMVIVSPYARPGYTDSQRASFVSVLAFIEHNWLLPPLTLADATAYDYAKSFDFSGARLGRVRMVDTPVPQWVTDWIEAHPPDPDDVN
jgi:phospholipase C